jgi:hypothetical protein
MAQRQALGYWSATRSGRSGAKPQSTVSRTSALHGHRVSSEALLLSIEGTRAWGVSSDLVQRPARRTADRERPNLAVARKAIEQVLVVVSVDRLEAA